MSITVLLTAKVEDFNKWKELFDEDEDKRVKGGIHANPHRDINDPNRLFIISNAPSEEAFMALFRDPVLIERRKEATVTVEEIKFLEKV